MFSFFRKRVTHPFFPNLAARPAASARGESKALAGTFRELAGAAARGAVARRAVYVLTTEGEPLSDGQRDEVWRRFQVPVYALVVEDGGSVIAWECEAQKGLHGAGGDAEACACGRPGAYAAVGQAMAHAAD
jgi:hypothetical protein